MNSSTNNTSQQINSIHCVFYRLIGSLLLIASIINLVFGYRYFTRDYIKQKKEDSAKRFSHIIISMLISSLLVIITGIPLVVVQCFSCQAYLQYDSICRLHGFMCFTTGIFNMYILALLSVFRYLSVLHKSSRLYRLMERHFDANLVACAILALAWATPPIFGLGTKYVREGVGFYCSLDWHNPSIHSRFFLLVLISFNYFIPLILLVYSNIRVSLTLHHLLKSRDAFSSVSTFKAKSPSSQTSYISDGFSHEIEIHRSILHTRSQQTASRLQRLRLDRRYARMTAIIASQYIIAWTPYACIEALSIMGHGVFVKRYSFLPTICALIAKLSLILNPLILMYTSRMTEEE